MGSHALPFVAAPVGTSAEVDAAAHAAAAAWGLPAPLLLRHGMNAVYAAGASAVLRVTRPTADAAVALELAARLAGDGIPVAQPLPHGDPPVLHVGDLQVVAFERLHAVERGVDWAGVGVAVARLHALDIGVVPAGHPFPRGLHFPWWDFATMLDDVEPDIAAADPAALGGLRAAVARHGAVVAAVLAPDVAGLVVCHGDVHPGNVVQTADGPVLLDWDLVCHEPRGWDHAALLTWTERWGGEPGLYERFAEGYGADLRADPFAVAAAELRLVAATLMRVRAGRADAGAHDEALRRLRWWRGDPDAPIWARPDAPDWVHTRRWPSALRAHDVREREGRTEQCQPGWQVGQK